MEIKIISERSIHKKPGAYIFLKCMFLIIICITKLHLFVKSLHDLRNESSLALWRVSSNKILNEKAKYQQSDIQCKHISDIYSPPRHIWVKGTLECCSSSLPVTLVQSEWGHIYFGYHSLETNVLWCSWNGDLPVAQ